ncbi:hypothetical protein MN608_11271 [Microdochium nivale]|nr:hypothetical protein MN608_11271 [Microdochium nivale]
MTCGQCLRGDDSCNCWQKLFDFSAAAGDNNDTDSAPKQPYLRDEQLTPARDLEHQSVPVQQDDTLDIIAPPFALSLQQEGIPI